VSATDACSVTEGCITCGDVAVPLTVIEARDNDARCRDDQGREELVAVELVGDVQPGDRVLVHAGVAIERLEEGMTRDALR
jgi:hydrogenase expression/formation protein HypC